VEQTESDVLQGGWPERADIVILPGIGSERMGDAFAPAAEDVKEELEAAGLEVAYVGGDGSLVILRKSADWWGPVIVAGTQWLQTHGIDFLADLITRAVSRTRDTSHTRAVVRIGRYRESGTEIEWLDYDGPADGFPAALKAWAKHKR
jgi:hypothetical protein